VLQRRCEHREERAAYLGQVVEVVSDYVIALHFLG
jgi:hypothetical protein